MASNATLKTVEVTQTGVICERPLGQRVGVGVTAVLVAAVCVVLLRYFWPTPEGVALRSPGDILSVYGPMLLVPLLGLCVPTALFLYFAGPADLILDTDRRTYRFRRGFPLLAAWQEGPLEDIAGLRVSAVSRRNGTPTASQLVLYWKTAEATAWTLGNGPVANRRPVLMGVSRDLDGLQQEAERLAGRLGVPVLDGEPPREQTRGRTGRRLLLIPAVLLYATFGLPPLLVGHALESQGRTTTGVVSSLSHEKTYRVRYAYAVGGHTFQGRSSISGADYADLSVGSPVAVRYLPAYPHTSTAVGSQDAGRGRLVLFYAVALVALGLWSTRANRADQTNRGDHAQSRGGR